MHGPECWGSRCARGELLTLSVVASGVLIIASGPSAHGCFFASVVITRTVDASKNTPRIKSLRLGTKKNISDNAIEKAAF